jgi:hypothetical protein
MRLSGKVLVCLFGGAALAQELDFKAIPVPSDKDDIAAAKLPPAEVRQILDHVEQTSFDVPDSWPTELRLPRMSIAGSDGLVVRGTALLCGGTGNCQTCCFAGRMARGSTWSKATRRSSPASASAGMPATAFPT